jgi:hypothetical protein
MTGGFGVHSAIEIVGTQEADGKGDSPMAEATTP